MKRHKIPVIRLLTLALSLSLTLAGLAPSLSAAPLLRDGGFLRIGAGFSPLAKTSLDLSDRSVTETGPALTIVGGMVWDRKHSIEIRWQNIYLGGQGGQGGQSNATQGTLAFTYTRYLAQRGPAPFFSGGIGLQHGPFVGGSLASQSTSMGAAVFIGAGLRFTRRLSLSADFSFGSTDRFFDNTFKFDFSHQQLVFSVQYTLLGG